jgi:hypothetical protein
MPCGSTLDSIVQSTLSTSLKLSGLFSSVIIVTEKLEPPALNSGMKTRLKSNTKDEGARILVPEYHIYRIAWIRLLLIFQARHCWYDRPLLATFPSSGNSFRGLAVTRQETRRIVVTVEVFPFSHRCRFVCALSRHLGRAGQYIVSPWCLSQQRPRPAPNVSGS